MRPQGPAGAITWTARVSSSHSRCAPMAALDWRPDRRRLARAWDAAHVMRRRDLDARLAGLVQPHGWTAITPYLAAAFRGARSRTSRSAVSERCAGRVANRPAAEPLHDPFGDVVDERVRDAGAAERHRGHPAANGAGGSVGPCCSASSNAANASATGIGPGGVAGQRLGRPRRCPSRGRRQPSAAA